MSLKVKAILAVVALIVLWIVATKIIGLVIGKVIFYGAILAVIAGVGYYAKRRLFGGARKTP